MPKFLIMLQENPSSFASVTPDDMAAIVAEYGGWVTELAAAGHLVTTEKLYNEPGRQITRTNGDIKVTDGPFVGRDDVVGGFFVVEAADYDHAVKLCDTSPHLTYGERIIKRVEPLPAPATP